MAYNKPWKSYSDQLQNLKDRGLTVTDESKAIDYLERIGYYRLSGYWYSFRKLSGLCCSLYADKRSRPKQTRLALDRFKEGATFQQAVDLYVFDKELRLLVLDALERIEIALRVDISHTLGKNHKFAYLCPDLFKDDFSKKLDNKLGITQHQHWTNNHARLINRSKEEFIKHNKNKYGLPLAIWVACEVWDFGAMSRLFEGMRPEDQNAIAQKYGLSKGMTLASWLRSLSYLRNVCAHHSRLWNRNMIDQPKKPESGEARFIQGGWDSSHVLARPFLQLCIAQHLLCVINPTSSWWGRLKKLLQEFPDLSELELSLESMGVIEGYEDWQW